MKLYIIVLISCILQFAYANIEELIAACPSCQIVKQCFDEHQITNNPKNPNGIIPVYPPDNYEETEFAKCVCSAQNINTYKECVPCNFQFKKLKNITPAAVAKKCEVFNVNGTTGQNNANNNANPADNTAANPATNPADSANSANSANTGSTNNNTGDANGNDNLADDEIPSTSDDVTSKQSSNKGSSTTKDDSGDNETKKNNGSNAVVYSVIGIVAAAGVIGFFVYKNKKKERPESMPFYGNATSPNKYPSLDLETKNTMSYISSVDYNNPNQTQNYQSNYDYTQNSQPYETSQYPSSYDYDNVTTTATADATVYAQSTEPSYDVRRESKNQFINPLPSDNYNPNASVFNCTYPYDPKLDDELELKLNDQIQIIEEYEDGWMKAINLTTKKEGMAPIVCVKPTN